MRLAAEKIKQGILHPDREVREMAVRYFAESFSHDPTIMPLVIEAIGKYGWQDNISAYAVREGLVQTDATLEWILSELSKDGEPKDEGWRNYTGGLQDLMTEADARLLEKHQPEILGLEGLDLSVREAVTERVQLLSADPDACWAELEEFCEREKSKQYINEVNFGRAYRLVEAIARHGDRYFGRVLKTLAQKVEDFTNHPMAWLEPLAVRLAGEMRLEAAVPLIAGKLHEEGDLLQSECERALWKIGTDAVVEAVCTGYSQAEWGYRLTGAAVLERIPSDLTVAKCLELLPQEKDDNIRVWLGQALLHQFSFDGIEPLRQLILGGPLDPEMRGLRRDFLTACTLMEIMIPEMEQWQEAAKHDVDTNKKFYAERSPGLAKLAACLGDEAEGQAEVAGVDDDEPLAPTRKKVGRNDPCPCGSGKKFKKCCLKKQDDGRLFD
jgi:hypothetical protein